MTDSREDLMTRVLRRWIEVFQDETRTWMANLAKGAINPDNLIGFIKSMGIDLSQLSGMVGQQAGLDPYNVLGLNKSASDDEVKRRYRELLHKLHPDTAGVTGTEFLLQMVIAAYELIKRERRWQ